MSWRHLSALFRNSWTQGNLPGKGSGRRLEHSEFVEYTEITEARTRPVEPVSTPEAVFALAVLFSAHLIPGAWVLSHMESYRRS